jgi:hypothetical protein
MSLPDVHPTNTPDVKRWTGVAAIAVAALLVTEFVLHQTVGARPELDQSDALVAFFVAHHTMMLTIVLIDTVLMASIIVFLAGFRQIITHARHDLQWIADVGFGAGLVFVAITMVGDAMEAGSALDVVRLVPDASAIRALTEGHAVMFGATGCVLLALVSASSGYVVLASGALPRWTGVVALAVAALVRARHHFRRHERPRLVLLRRSGGDAHGDLSVGRLGGHGRHRDDSGPRRIPPPAPCAPAGTAAQADRLALARHARETPAC